MNFPIRPLAKSICLIDFYFETALMLDVRKTPVAEADYNTLTYAIIHSLFNSQY